MKKAQAAMEFLMTYGWAILVVLIVIASLAYFGVLNPTRFLPEKCTFSTGVSCGDFVAGITGGGTPLNSLQIRLQNNLGETVTIVDGGINLIDMEPTHDFISSVPTPRVWEEGAVLTILATSNVGTVLDVGQRYKLKIEITYTGSSSLSRTITGEVTGRVES